MTGDRASIQVYEETSGLGPGAEVVTTGAPLSVELGPGLIENIYDGIQRPLEEITQHGRGSTSPAAFRPRRCREDKKWDFTPAAKPGDAVVAGDVLGTVPETTSVLHKIMVPHRMDGHRGVDRSRQETTPSGTDHRQACVTADGALKRADHGAEVARPCGAALSAEIPALRAAAVRPAGHRHHVPRGQGRHRRRPRPLRLRARRWCSISWPSGRTWTSWSTSAAASAATR